MPVLAAAPLGEPPLVGVEDLGGVDAPPPFLGVAFFLLAELVATSK